MQYTDEFLLQLMTDELINEKLTDTKKISHINYMINFFIKNNHSRSLNKLLDILDKHSLPDDVNANLFIYYVSIHNFAKAEYIFNCGASCINFTYCFIIMCEKKNMISAEWIYDFSHSIYADGFDDFDDFFGCSIKCEFDDDKRETMSLSKDHKNVNMCVFNNYVFRKNINDKEMFEFLLNLAKKHNVNINI